MFRQSIFDSDSKYFLNKLITRFNLDKTLYRNAFFLVVNSISNNIFGLLFWNIMAKNFTPAEVGVGSALVAASGLLSSIANMGLGGGIIRYMPEMRYDSSKLINTCFTLSSLVALIGCFIFICGLENWGPELMFIKDNSLMTILFVIITLTLSLSVLTDQSFIAGRNTSFVLKKNMITNILKLPLPILFYTYKGFGIFGGAGIASIVGLVTSWFFFMPRLFIGFLPHPTFYHGIIKTIIPFSFANYLVVLFNSLPNFTYPIMVFSMLGEKESAYFYISWMMTMVLSIIPSSIAQSLFAEGSLKPNKMGVKTRNALMLSISLTIPAVIIMIIFRKFLLNLFGHEYVEKGSVLVLYLSLAVVPQCINMIFVALNQVRKKLSLAILHTGAIASISLISGYWFIGLYKLNGIGIAYSLAQITVATIIIIPLLKIKNENEIDKRKTNT